MTRSCQITSCLGFLQALEARFASSQYEDPIGILFKLTQCGSVADYLSQFESFTNRIVGLPTPFLLSCFISGLALDIRHEVQAVHPLTLTHATALARLQEEKLANHHCAFRRRFVANPPSSFPTTTPLALLPPPAKPPPLPLKRLSPEEMVVRPKKGFALIAMRSSLGDTSVPPSSSFSP